MTGVTDEFQQLQLAKHFLQAAEEGRAAVVSRLLRQGVDVNVRDEAEMSERYSAGWTAGKTALIRAAQQVVWGTWVCEGSMRVCIRRE